jgi:hypothetical protein
MEIGVDVSRLLLARCMDARDGKINGGNRLRVQFAGGLGGTSGRFLSLVRQCHGVKQLK